MVLRCFLSIRTVATSRVPAILSSMRSGYIAFCIGLIPPIALFLSLNSAGGDLLIWFGLLYIPCLAITLWAAIKSLNGSSQSQKVLGVIGLVACILPLVLLLSGKSIIGPF